MKSVDPDAVRTHVRVRYAEIAAANGNGCCSVSATRCHQSDRGYGQQGCGNPIALASIRLGEAVLDLGSGAGFDCFLAAQQLGGTGRVIGVDMTPAMVAKARHNAREGNYTNVEFRLGEIEALPVADNSVDLVISNCVINLSPEKPRVFREAFRVLKPGGRLVVADIVAIKPLPESIRMQLNAIGGCIAGAALIDDLKMMLSNAGFVRTEIVPRVETRSFISGWTEDTNASDSILSAFITAYKAA